MFICKRGCRKCFPHGCCGFCKPPPQEQKQIDNAIHLKKLVEKKVTPYGFINIYPGVRTSENNYTCPMLSVHLYRVSQYTADSAQDKRVISVDSRNQAEIHQGPQKLKREENAAAEEEVMMLPLEDVTKISFKSEIKKGIQADIQSQTEAVYKLSENGCDRCCANLLNCCRKTRDCCCYCCKKEIKIAPLVVNTTILFTDEDVNRNTHIQVEHLPLPKEKGCCCTRCITFFRCWCCRKKNLVDLIRRTNTNAERQAQRVITITIEYSKYSNLDTASNARLLSSEQQVAYYKEKFQPDTELQFYLVNNTEFGSENFELKKKQAENLCRTIMQMKGMRNHYPSDNELEKILDLPQRRTYGDVYVEPILELPFHPSAARGIEGNQPQGLPQPPQQQRITKSGNHEEAEKKAAGQDNNIDKDGS